MFGCYGIYVRGKIVLVLRKRARHPSMNGVWVATRKEHHTSLRKILPSMKSIDVFGKGETNWQILHEDDRDFESAVLAVCRLIEKGDPRIGSVPKKRRR